MRVLVIKRDKLGDLLLTTPVLAHVKAVLPGIELHLLANDYNAWVASGHPALARIWIYPRVKHDGRVRLGAALAHLPLLWNLRRAKFDWAIALGGEESHRAVKRAMATGAKRVIAYAQNPPRYGPRLTDPLPPPTTGHETARMMALFAPLGIAPPLELPDPEYRCPVADIALARGWLAQMGLAHDGYMVVGLGARRPDRQPSPAQVIRWAHHFHRTWGLATVITWTPGARNDPLYPGDDAMAEQVLANASPHIYPYRGTFRGLLGVINCARASVVPDSGLMHFAAASPGGVVGLFAHDPSQSVPASRWAPLGARAVQLEAKPAVSDLRDETIFSAVAPLATRSPFAR